MPKSHTALAGENDQSYHPATGLGPNEFGEKRNNREPGIIQYSAQYCTVTATAGLHLFISGTVGRMGST
jgi:hypothetical protein